MKKPNFNLASLGIPVLATALMLVFSGAAFAGDIVVSLKTNAVEAVPGQTLEVQVVYDATDGNNQLTGAALKVHFSQEELIFEGYDNFFVGGDVVVQPTLGNSEEGAKTGYISLGWVSIAKSWPGTELPKDLAVLKFRVKETKEGEVELTPEVVKAAEGYGSIANKLVLPVAKGQ
jgi:hypothetical protein